ncbi:outer membrane protein assembly factor BamE [Loktanella agnita]|uniref:outer membrane protein assembly factor BamE n=1 Tax=Loktanella agnita TaxID=287097 RepID=UPI003985B56A
MGRQTGKTFTWLRAAGLTGLLLATACSPINRYHGFTPTAAELSRVQVGQSTRESVAERLGPPTSEGLLENNSFYYVSSQFRTIGPFAPEELNREVLAIRFSPSGVVRNVERYGLEDGRVIALDRRVTEDGINDVTFLGQLLGSFGRIDAGTLLGETGGSDF